MKELLALVCDRLAKNVPLVMATVVHHEGSTPRSSVSKMLVDHSGLIHGTIGGGLAEAEAIKACNNALENQKAEILKFTLTGEQAASGGMICGGALSIFVEPLLPEEDTLAFFRQALNFIEEHEVIVISSIEHDKKLRRALCIDGQWDAQFFPDALKGVSVKATYEDLLMQMPRGTDTLFVEKHGQMFFVEKYPPTWRMIIAGGGHVSFYTAQAAALAGFSVVVLDDREEFSSAERFPSAAATHTVPGFAQCFAACLPNKHTCIVIVTRGHMHDKIVLEQALETKASYIGMIGSKRKRDHLYAELRSKGVAQSILDSIYCPIGLSINAETPEEIAICIVAECVAHKRGALNVS